MNCLYCLPAGKGKLIEQLKIDVPIYGISPLKAKSNYKRILFFLVAMSNTFTTSNSTQWRKREGAQIVAGRRIAPGTCTRRPRMAATATAIPSSAATDFQEYNDMQTLKRFAKVSLFHTLGHDPSNYIPSTGYFEKELLLRPPPRSQARFSRVRLSQPARGSPPLYVVVNMQNLKRICKRAAVQ